MVKNSKTKEKNASYKAHHKTFFMLCIVLLTSILCVELVLAASGDLVSNPTIDISSVQGSGTAMKGMNITMNASTNIKTVVKDGASGATKAYITSADCSSVLATANFVGNNATFDYPTLVGDNYCVLVDDNGGSWGSIGDGTALPINREGLSYNSAWNGAAKVDNQIYDIENIYTQSGLGASISLTSPSSGYVTSLTSLNLTAEFNITGTNRNYTWRNATFYNWKSGVLYNQSLVYLSGNNTQNTTQISGLTLGSYSWNVYGCYANNTFSNCTFAETNSTFEYRPFEINSQDYNAFVYETEYQRFNLSITTIEDILSVTSKLNYNGTLYNGNTSCSAGVCTIFSNIDIPLVNSPSMNKSFFWQITVYDGSTSYIFNTSDQTKQQNISRIYLEECNATYTTKAINFTAYIEGNLSQINPFQISGTFNFWLGSGSAYRNISFNKAATQNLSVCISPIDKTFYSDAQLDYSYGDENITYVSRNYYLDNATLNNITQEIPLYLLNAEDSTTFIIKVQDQKLSAVENALVYIQRYYPSDGTFKTVQIAKTDSNGETIGFYETETVDYRHIIIKDGEILLTTTQQKVVGKDVPYTLTFTTGESLGYPWASFQKNGNVYSALSFNETTKIVTFTYIDSTGDTSSARLVVFKESMTNSTNQTICDTSSSQSSATITCNLTSYSGNFIAYGYIESDITDIINIIITGAKEIFDREGLLLGMFIIMVSGFAFMWNPTSGIVAMNAALIFTNLIGFISVSPVFIFGSIAISFIAIILLKT